MKIERKTMAVAMASVILLATVAGGAWYCQRLEERGSVPCAQQQPSQFAPYCLAQAQAAAGRGDRAAMAALVEYFEKREPAQVIHWTRAAAKLGEPRALSRLLSSCGTAGPFSVEEAQALLPAAPLLDALNFRLGGSCAPADMEAARALAPAALLAEPDGATLCKVAVRYGLLRLSRDGAQLDSQAAQQLLAECERRQQVPAAVRKESETVRQMLAREINPVRISVD